jgi:hypothetical protein
MMMLRRYTLHTHSTNKLCTALFLKAHSLNSVIKQKIIEKFS